MKHILLIAILVLCSTGCKAQKYAFDDFVDDSSLYPATVINGHYSYTKELLLKREILRSG